MRPGHALPRRPLLLAALAVGCSPTPRMDAGPGRARPDGLESLARRTGIVPSRDAEQARLVRALAGEVETVLREVAGVLAARVLLSLPDPAPLATAEPAAPRAGVVVRYRAPDGEGPPITEDAVRRNYPLIGRFRGLFSALGEFFRQYFFLLC